ncbi:cytochrome P450 81Q32-like [Rutidosis leptorrhynchoides]|uniref:cytochrome P450 81Q32-like n=1 Tax=Rutidosis leptorrhynchoides TaxID=125765 RepID=UPI003A9A3A1F
MENLAYIIVFPIIIYMITKHFIHKLRKFPPRPFFSIPIIGHLYLVKNPMHRTLVKISSKYGPVVFLEFGLRPVLLVSSPSAAEDCFTANDQVFANRPKLTAGKHLGYNFTTLPWAPYGPYWRNLRKIVILEILSNNRIQTFTNIRYEEIRSFISSMNCRSREGQFKVVDMKSSLFKLSLNMIMRMITGRKEAPEARKFKELVEDDFRLSGASNIGDFVPMVRWIGLNSMEKEMEKLKRKRDSAAQDLIKLHRTTSHSSPDASKTIIDVLLSLQEIEPESYTDEIIKGLILVLISTGTDTSAGTLEWALSLLLNHPDSLKKLSGEIDSKVGPSRLVNDSDLSNLPYLHGVINETLRMCPVGALIPPHESTKECNVGGFKVPSGTMLLVNLWAIQNDPKLWNEPERFMPERFIGFEGQRDGFKFMPFGSGRRGCPGEGLAMRMIGLTLGTLVQCFEWERIGVEKVDMTEGAGLTMPKAQPLVAKYRPRPRIVDLLSRI